MHDLQAAGEPRNTRQTPVRMTKPPLMLPAATMLHLELGQRVALVRQPPRVLGQRRGVLLRALRQDAAVVGQPLRVAGVRRAHRVGVQLQALQLRFQPVQCNMSRS